MEPVPDSQQSAEAPESDDPPKNEAETEAELLLSRAQKIIDKIMANHSNPRPNLFHALASMMETQESRYLQESGHSSFNNGRASHTIGKLGNLIRENDEFYECITSKFISDSMHPVNVHLAAARLLLSTSPTWMYPIAFEDEVLDSIKRWVLDDTARASGDECNGRLKWKRNKPTDTEMMRTYATGILAASLAGSPQVVEDVTAGLSAKLMRFLRSRVLGEVSTSQKDVSHPTENKHLVPTSIRSREETRSRFRQITDATHLDGSRMSDIGLLDEQNVERDHDRGIGMRQVRGEECWVDGGEASAEAVGMFKVDDDDDEQIDEDRRQSRDLRDVKAKSGDRFGTSRPTRDEDGDESARDDSSRRRANRGWTKIRGRGRINEGTAENERALTSPGTGTRSGQGQSVRDRHFSRTTEMKRATETRMYSVKSDDDCCVMERDYNDDFFKDCKFGTKDISDLVMKAISAAETEARSANAPVEAIKAAGDAAAELVKTAALEVLKSTNDEEAAVLAASKAVSTVVDAAMVIEVSRSSTGIKVDSESFKASEPETDEELEEFFILDDEALARMREKYCIQCLEILGAYVEVLGPVLHEKGVDVCLALLQRSSKHKESSEFFTLLPDVLKLICALAAHRKFAAVFVDRGGMQKLLAVQRVPQTFFGLSSCLFTIGSLQGIMERVCALPSEVVQQVVELALQLLECSQDQARKNAAVFFAAAFVFRAILDSYDAQDGLQKMLNLLHSAASVRSGVNSGTLAQSNLGSLRNDRSPAEVLTSSEKQIACHTCIALRQYFRAHLLLLVDSLRPNKNRSVARNVVRAAYKPLDISNEAMDAVFLQIQRDRKLGPAFVRARWAAVDKFLSSNGHIIMLELCQAPPVESYLHDLAQYALGVLHIVTLVPYSRKLIVNATLSNERVGMAVVLDAANGAGYVDPEVIHPALNVLVNLVCPPPSISNKPPVIAQGQVSGSVQTLNGPTADSRDRNAERNFSDRTASMPSQSESRERNGEPSSVERSSAATLGTPSLGNSSLTAVPTVASGVVGDRRISLGPGAGCAGLAAQLEQGYRQAREAVRANNGIKVLLHLLRPRIFTSPAALDCLRALACRVLLGLARDGTIAHILTKLQVGKKLSELIRDSGSQASGTEQGRWQAELAQVAIELISIVTNSGRASTLAATDAAAPTLRRIERAAIAAATPITYHSRELLQLMHEHLQLSGLTATAASLLMEAQLTPLLPLASPTPLLHQTSVQETSSIQLQWPSSRASGGFLSDTSKTVSRGQIPCVKTDSLVSLKKPLVFSSKVNSQGKIQPPSHLSSINKVLSSSKNPCVPVGAAETPSPSFLKPNSDSDPSFMTPIVLPMKRKLMESKDICFSSPAKRTAASDLGFYSPICQTPNTACKGSHQMDSVVVPVTPCSNVRYPCGRPTPIIVPAENADDVHYHATPVGPTTPSTSQLGLLADPQAGNAERVTLDSLVVQYLKHQHRQCPAPITTLPPLSLLHPHVCPEPSRNLNAPTNITARLSTREFKNKYGGSHGFRRDRQFVYSRFRPLRSCKDDVALLSCITFLEDYSRIATGCHSGEVKIFDTNSGNVLESHSCHQSPVVFVKSVVSGDTQLLLSSGTYDVRLWDASSLSSGPIHQPFEGCKAAQFSHSGAMFAALSTESSQREVRLYDVQTSNLDQKLTDTSTTPSGPVRGHVQSLIHFSPLDTMLLWNGVLWDRRGPGPVHRFDQFTDYGGGGFHPAGNEVIINSEVWDLRKFKLLRSVPSLDQTVITFNTAGNVIYAILRRNLEDITSAVQTRRVRHPLFAAFRTVDAVNYSDIATVPVDRCVLDFATEPIDSFVGLVSMDDHDEMFSFARLYEIGRRRPTDDDSDPDDGVDSEEEEDEDDDSEADEDPTLGPDLDSDINSDAEDLSNEEDDDESVDELDDDDDDVEFNLGLELDGAPGILDIGTDGDDDDDSQVVDSFSSEDEGGFADHRFGF